MQEQDYRPSLSLVELLGELSELIRRQRLTERLVCRYLADLADRMDGPDAMLNGYVDVYHLARSELGLGLRSTRERVRIGRALRGVPRIERAFVAGEISYSKVRELTRVASPQSEGAWLAAARELSVRELERRVVAAHAAAGLDAGGHVTAGLDAGGHVTAGLDAAGLGVAVHDGGVGAGDDGEGVGAGDDGEVARSSQFRSAGPSRERAETEFLSPNLMELRIRLRLDEWALLERALQGARNESESSLSDAEALAAVARDALAQQSGGDSDLDVGATHSGSSAGGSSAGVAGAGATHSGSSANEASEGVGAVVGQSGSSAGGSSAGGSSVGVGGEGATQSGSSAGGSSAGGSSAGELTPDARKLLGIIGRRGAWYMGDLLEASGLDYTHLSVGLFHLQIQGHVTQDKIGRYLPTG